MDTKAWVAKKAYFKVLRNQKKEHLEDFLDNTKNIWQAAIDLSDQTVKPSFSTITRVRNSSDLEVKTPEDIDNMLLDSFFSLPPPWPRSIVHSPGLGSLETNQLPGIPLTLEKVRHATFKVSPLK